MCARNQNTSIGRPYRVANEAFVFVIDVLSLTVIARAPFNQEIEEKHANA